MKKMKKWIALALASAMCMGMGMTAFAANSPGADLSAYGEGEDGTTYSIIGTEPEDRLTNEEAAEILAEQYNIPEGATVHILGQQDFELAKGEKMPEGGLDLKIFLEYGTDVQNGDTVYVLHFNAEKGAWDVYAATVVNGNMVKVHVDSLSPFAVLKVMSSGKVIPVDPKNPPQPSKTSPKTGE